MDFIEALTELAETCQFGMLKEELIRDRIAVGIRNAQLSQRSMLNEKLTLDKAINEAKSSELTKQHHEILKGDSEDEQIDRIQNDRRINQSRENNKILDKEINVIDVANHQHTREKIVRLSMGHA